MMVVVSDVVVQIGGTVRPEPDPDMQLAQMAKLFDTEEYAELMREYHAGHWLLAYVEMFADVVSEEGVRRIHDGDMRPLTLGVPHDEANVTHVREAVAQCLDGIAAALTDNDIDIAAEELGRLPVLIELDHEIEKQISVATTATDGLSCRQAERHRIADQRDRIADQRDRIADERDRIADEREGIEDQREALAGGSVVPREGERVAREDARRERERARARREQAAVKRRVAKRERAVGADQ